MQPALATIKKDGLAMCIQGNSSQLHSWRRVARGVPARMLFLLNGG